MICNWGNGYDTKIEIEENVPLDDKSSKEIIYQNHLNNQMKIEYEHKMKMEQLQKQYEEQKKQLEQNYYSNLEKLNKAQPQQLIYYHQISPYFSKNHNEQYLKHGNIQILNQNDYKNNSNENSKNKVCMKVPEEKKEINLDDIFAQYEKEIKESDEEYNKRIEEIKSQPYEFTNFDFGNINSELTRKPIECNSQNKEKKINLDDIFAQYEKENNTNEEEYNKRMEDIINKPFDLMHSNLENLDSEKIIKIKAENEAKINYLEQKQKEKELAHQKKMYEMEKELKASIDRIKEEEEKKKEIHMKNMKDRKLKYEKELLECEKREMEDKIRREDELKKLEIKKKEQDLQHEERMKEIVNRHKEEIKNIENNLKENNKAYKLIFERINADLEKKRKEYENELQEEKKKNKIKDEIFKQKIKKIEEESRQRKLQIEKEIEQIKSDNERILKEMEKNSEEIIKNIKIRNKADIDKINEKYKNKIIFNEQRINEILNNYNNNYF